MFGITYVPAYLRIDSLEFLQEMGFFGAWVNCVFRRLDGQSDCG